jgi:DNA uptake protein ComE-like DNA-binding protein
MKLYWHKMKRKARPAEGASVLIIVLWMTIGLIGITLYFANSMTLELRASDNRTSGLAAEQAIEGAARYVGWALSNFATNGTMPTNSQFVCEAIPIGDARVWIIGRDTSGKAETEPTFALIDEASKLNLNTANTNTLAYLPDMDFDLAEAIVDWRSTNSTMSPNYASFGYEDKHAPFETVDELRLVYGMTLDDLAGDDANLNGILDVNEKGSTGSKTASPGLLEYTTIYSREPNFNADGSMLTNVNTRAQLQPLLSSTFGASRSQQIIAQLGLNGPNGPTRNSLLRFYLDSGLSTDDFDRIYDGVTTTTNRYIDGRVNINTASEPVLTALFMGAGVDENTAVGAAETLISYRQQNPNSLDNIAWIVSALGRDNNVVTALARRDWITTRSYQFTADIAAVGPFGRGYRRVKFVFDITEGTPKIIFRQDLSRLGWALGQNVREISLAQNSK